MEGALPPAAWVSIGTAVASLIVVPFVVHMIKHFLQTRREAKAAELAKVLAMYVTKVEHDTRSDRVELTHAKWHQETKDFLDTIRTEAHTREQRIVGQIDKLSVRVDNVFERLPPQPLPRLRR